MEASWKRLGRLGVGALAGILAAETGARAQVVHTEDFETGGLGAYTEVDIIPGGGNSLWHGDAICGDLPGTLATCFDDNTSTIQAMPFPFSFFGVAKTQFRANSNGWMIMNGAGSTASSFTNTVFPSTAGPEDLACPWWDDQELTVGGISKISTLLTGTPGTQVLTVQWTANATWTSANACPVNDGSNLTYQVQLYEATGDIEFRYDHAGFLAGTVAISASVGAENAAGTVGVDATGLGIANTTFPTSGGFPTDLLLAPAAGTYVVSAIAPAWSSIVGMPGEVNLLAATAAAPGATIPMPVSFGTNAASYNRGDELPPVYNYTIPAGANSGAIESPVFAVPAGAFDLAVSYDTHREMETGTSFDQSFVEARGGASPNWGQVFMQTTNSSCSAGPTTITASSAATQTLAGKLGGQIRFRLNTVDGVANATDGWSVDNVSVSVASVPGIARMAPPTPCAGSGGCVPVAGWSGGAPSVSAAGPFALTLSQALGGAPAVLAIGLLGGPPFPIDLGFVLGGGPCYLMNDAIIIVTGLTTTGAAACDGTLSIPISLAGATPGGPILAQFFVVDPASPLIGLPVVGSDQLAVTLLP